MGKQDKKNISAQNVENGEFDRAKVKEFLSNYDADEVIEGPGRFITRQELLESAKRAEEEGVTLESIIEEQEAAFADKEKKHYGEIAEIPVLGPTSFGELDEEREARDRAYEAQRVTWDAETLIRNVIHNPLIEPDEKSEKISAIGNDMAARVSDAMKGETKEFEDDFDVLHIQASLKATEPNMMEKTSELIQKARLTTSARSKLPDSSFALVIERDGKTIREYPIHDKAHVRNSLEKVAQQIKSGGDSEGDARTALPKIRDAAKKMGIGAYQSEDFQNSFVVEKDAEGNYRWIGWVTNNFKDRDKEILTDAAHKDYIDWLDENPDVAPVLLIWHMPGTRMEKEADFWMYENGFVTMSGPLTEKEAFGLLKMGAKEQLGMSHGFFVTGRDPENQKHITNYRTYEVSVLPLSKAANPWTNIQAIIKEVATMSGKTELLATYLGDEEKAAAFLERADLMQEKLREAEVDEKEAETPTEDAKPDADVSVEPEVKEMLETLTPHITEAVLKEIGIDGLEKWVEDATKQLSDTGVIVAAILEKLEKSDKTKEDELVDMLAPAAKKNRAWNQPSKADDNVLDPEKKQDKELQDKAPGLPEDAWLSKATGTTPVMADA